MNNATERAYENITFDRHSRELEEAEDREEEELDRQDRDIRGRGI